MTHKTNFLSLSRRPLTSKRATDTRSESEYSTMALIGEKSPEANSTSNPAPQPRGQGIEAIVDHIENFLGMVRLGCMRVMLRYL